MDRRKDLAKGSSHYRLFHQTLLSTLITLSCFAHGESSHENQTELTDTFNVVPRTARLTMEYVLKEDRHSLHRSNSGLDEQQVWLDEFVTLNDPENQVIKACTTSNQQRLRLRLTRNTVQTIYYEVRPMAQNNASFGYGGIPSLKTPLCADREALVGGGYYLRFKPTTSSQLGFATVPAGHYELTTEYTLYLK